MTLTQALRENMGDPERKTWFLGPETSGKKKKSEDSQRKRKASFQEVGLDHSSEEVR
jgi:hypothetical protein